jgi:5'-3' exonuclease
VHAPDGTSVNAVRGLLDFISRLVSAHQPTHLVACWDEDWRPGWRVALIPSYKGHRVVRPVPGGVDVEETPDPLEAQIPIIEEVLEALQIPVVGAAHFEADDIIGTLATSWPGEVDIVTGDRDLFQLVSNENHIRVLYIARGVSNLEIVDDGTVVRKYGVLPEQYADFAALRGDASDGLPGVKGIGDKTAASLMQQYGDLEGIIAAANDPRSSLASGVRGKLLAAADYLKVAPTVVGVVKDITLAEFDAELRPLTTQQRAVIEELAEKWGLGSAVPRLLGVLDGMAGSSSAP